MSTCTSHLARTRCCHRDVGSTIYTRPAGRPPPPPDIFPWRAGVGLTSNTHPRLVYTTPPLFGPSLHRSVEFLLPHPERAAFRSAVTADFDVLTDDMIRIDLEHAIAPEDGMLDERASIDAAVRGVEGDAARLNYELGVALRDWVFRLLVELVEEDDADMAAASSVPELDRIDFAKLCYNAGSILADNEARVLFGEGEGVGDSHDVAVELCDKAAAAFEAVLGPDHVDTAKSLANAADMHDRLGDPERALELYSRVLTIEETVAGAGHPSTAATHDCLGTLLGKLGDHAQALKHHIAALQIYEDVVAAEGGNGGGENDDGAVDLMAAKSHSHLGLLYLGLDDTENAMAHYSEGVRIFEAKLGEGHVNTADCYAGVAAVHYAAVRTLCVVCRAPPHARLFPAPVGSVRLRSATLRPRIPDGDVRYIR